MNDDKYAKLVAAVRMLKARITDALPSNDIVYEYETFRNMTIEGLDAILKEHVNVDSTADDAVASPPVCPEHGPEHNPGYDAIDW